MCECLGCPASHSETRAGPRGDELTADELTD